MPLLSSINTKSKVKLLIKKYVYFSLENRISAQVLTQYKLVPGDSCLFLNVNGTTKNRAHFKKDKNCKLHLLSSTPYLVHFIASRMKSSRRLHNREEKKCPGTRLCCSRKSLVVLPRALNLNVHCTL